MCTLPLLLPLESMCFQDQAFCSIRTFTTRHTATHFSARQLFQILMCNAMGCCLLQVYLNPERELSDMPLKTFYRYVLPEPSPAGEPDFYSRQSCMWIIAILKGTRMRSESFCVTIVGCLCGMTTPSEAQSKLLTLVAAIGVCQSAFGMAWCPQLTKLYRKLLRTVCT